MADKAFADLGAASYHSDELFFLVSAARLLRAVGGYLFAVNRQFEPSGRMLAKRLTALPVLPDGFIGQLESFLRHGDGLSFEAKREIAAHMVRDLSALHVEPRRLPEGVPVPTAKQRTSKVPRAAKAPPAPKQSRVSTKARAPKNRRSAKPLPNRGSRRK
jgi:hypothetical protein